MERIYINDNWNFKLEETEEYRKVRLPHSAVEHPFDYFSEKDYQKVSIYRRYIDIPDQWKDKRIILTFEAVAHRAEVYLNDRLLGEHNCGYTAFSFELTDYINPGRNEIKVIADSRENLNIPPFGFVIDYLTYSGIYRDVYLEIGEKTFIEDVFFNGNASGKVKSRIKINKKAEDNSVYSIRQYLADQDGDISIGQTSIPADKPETVLECQLNDIKKWTTDSPYLYSLVTELSCQDRLIDLRIDKVGFRTIEAKADGFYLNGEKIKIRGLNRHQSYPYVGYAMPQSMQEADADILKYKLGCNAVRTSHYPQSQYFIDRCDRIGLLVFTEIPGWQHIGDEKWKRQAVENVREMVEQYRNHPSIFMWGVRINESVDDDELYRQTNETARALDDSRPTGGVRCFRQSSLLEDVYTYNDFNHSGANAGCLPKEKVTPDMSKTYMITEYNGHMYPTKNFDSEEHRLEHALRHARVLDAVAGYEDIAGSFGWCMFDYNTHKDFGSGDRICYHGVLDMFRNPKLAAAVYSAQADYEDVLEISSSMDIGEHPAGNRGKIYIITNADSVKMYINDVFIKEYHPEESTFRNLKKGPILIDDFIGSQIYEKENFKPKQAGIITKMLNYVAINGNDKLPMKIKLGMLKCIIFYGMKQEDAYQLFGKYVGNWGKESTVFKFEAIKKGKVVKTVIKTPMNNAGLAVEVSKKALREEHSYDVASINIRAVDENGSLLAFCNEALEISAEGDVDIIGPKLISLKGGMSGTYVKSLGKSGRGRVRIYNPQLGEELIEFTVDTDKK